MSVRQKRIDDIRNDIENFIFCKRCYFELMFTSKHAFTEEDEARFNYFQSEIDLLEEELSTLIAGCGTSYQGFNWQVVFDYFAEQDFVKNELAGNSTGDVSSLQIYKKSRKSIISDLVNNPSQLGKEVKRVYNVANVVGCEFQVDYGLA